MLIVAVLLGIGGGVAYAISWWLVPENTEFVAEFTSEKFFNGESELRPAEGMEGLADILTMPVIIAIFAAAALLIVLAIVLLIVAKARKNAARRKANRAFEAEAAPVAIPVAAAPVASAPATSPAQTKPALALSDDKKELIKKVLPFAIAGVAVIAVIAIAKRSSNKR